MTLGFWMLDRVSRRILPGHIVAEFAGGAAGAVSTRPEAPMEPKTAKVFHDPRYHRSLASEMPAMPV